LAVKTVGLTFSLNFHAFDVSNSACYSVTVPKRDKKLVLRKLVQYAKVDSCVKGTPCPQRLVGSV